MTKAASYDAVKCQKSLKISEYAGIDYILIEVLKAFFLGTIAFGAGCVLWAGWKWTSLNEYFFDANYMGFAREVLMVYGICMAAYLVVVAVAAWARHRNCRRKRDQLLSLLKLIQ